MPGFASFRTGERRPRHASRPRLARTLWSVVVAAAALAVLSPASGRAEASLTLIEYPHELVSLTDRVTVTWAEEVSGCVRYGRAPGDYSARTVSEGVGSLTFVPLDEGMPHGILYCVVSDVTTGDTSEEFTLIIEAPIFPNPRTPPNGSLIDETTTLLEWDPVDGVPYYHVVVSDHEIEIAEQDGELALNGASLIWQAITSETSIQYGARDPSGFFVGPNGVSPPLMSGFTYNWLIFNNYGNDPLLTSTSGAGLASFTTDVAASVTAPVLTSPPDSVAVADEIVDFEWEPVPGASGYHVYIREERTWENGSASYPVWDNAVTEPHAEARLASFLPSGEYSWRVIAIDSAGRAAASDLRRFHYETETGTALIDVSTEQGERLPRVLIEIEFASGGVEATPTVTDDGGACSKDLIPGEYIFLASKDGYVDTTACAVIMADTETQVHIEMRRSPARIRGIVTDEESRPVFDASVVASSAAGQVETTSDRNGNFVIDATAGTWSVAAAKPGYESTAAETVRLAAGDYAELAGPLVLIGSPGVVTGNVLNTTGNPVAGATVWADNASGSFAAATNASGGFSLEVSPGAWTITAEKSGFNPSEPREITVAAGSNVEIDPPILLTAAASAIMGRVTDGHVDIAGATVLAVPPSGDVVRTTTNSRGEFVMLPPPAAYALVAVVPGYGPSEPQQVNVESGEAFTGIELVVTELSSTVTGVVVDGTEPVEGAVVSDGRSETVTSSDGSFELDVAPGIHEIVVRKDGCFSGPPLVVATAPGQRIGDLTLRTTRGASSISGRVLASGLPVPRAVVRAETEDISIQTRTDDFGAYALFVESGQWVVTAEREGFQSPEGISVLVAPDQSASGVDLALTERFATIAGTVTDPNGVVRRATILAYKAGEVCPSHRTSASSNGRYALRLKPECEYTIEVRSPGHGVGRVSVASPAPGDETIIHVNLPRYEGRLAGHVMGTAGPIEGARVVAVWGDSVAVTTDCRGAFEVWLDDGLYDVRIEAPGYDTRSFHDVEVISGETLTIDAELAAVFASLEGTVSDTLTGAPIPGALVTARWDVGGASCLTDADGAYRLGSVVPGTATVMFSCPGYREAARTVDLDELETGVLDIVLLGLTGTIAGTVRDAEGLGLAGVSVRAKLGEVVASAATTDGDGRYVLSGLDPEDLYDVYASIDGYYPGSENPWTDVPTGTIDADFTMLPADGELGGTVRDGATGEPLVAATVTADDGLGHFGSATTGPDGSFLIAGLVPTGNYRVTAKLFGYHEAFADSVAPGQDNLVFSLPRNFGNITGSVSCGDGLPPEELEVVATNTSFAGDSRAATPDALGEYDIADLRPGSYVVSVSGQGCVVTPAQISVEVGEGQAIYDLDFAVERAVVERVEVSGPTWIEAGGEAIFNADAFADSDRLVDTELEWWASPHCAGAIDRSTGRFSCAPDYIGELTVAACDPNSGRVGKLSASVFAEIGPSTEIALVDSAGMTLSIRRGAIEETKQIFLSHEDVPNAKRFWRDFVVSGVSYQLKPEGLSFMPDEPPVLALPANGCSKMAIWNTDQLTWDLLEYQEVAGNLEASIDRLGEYATLAESEPLGVRDVRVEPNPFSPDTGPVTISFEVSSRDARMPFVTVRVYNMAATLVREVMVNEPQGKGRVSVEWDGMTDDGEMARNGRYVVEIRAEDSTGSEMALATVVMIK